MTYAERLAATLAAAPSAERYPHGKPTPADPWAHVAGRGHTTTKRGVEMTSKQVAWARAHDWFYVSERALPGMRGGPYQVWVTENGKLHPWPFTDYNELRRWAGY